MYLVQQSQEGVHSSEVLNNIYRTFEWGWSNFLLQGQCPFYRASVFRGFIHFLPCQKSDTVQMLAYNRAKKALKYKTLGANDTSNAFRYWLRPAQVSLLYGLTASYV